MTPKRPNETVTQFSMRLIRNEVLERAIKVCEDEKVDAGATGICCDVAYNMALDYAIESIRALQQE